MAKEKKTADLPDGTISCKGVNGTVIFDGSWVTISRTGFLGRTGVGKGEKRIAVAQITSVRWKPPGIVNGYISFTLAGGNETRSRFGSQTIEASKDENAVIVARKQVLAFQELRSAIELAIAQHHGTSQTVRTVESPAPDLADQLRKLAELHDSGLITEEEFATKRANLIDRL